MKHAARVGREITVILVSHLVEFNDLFLGFRSKVKN